MQLTAMMERRFGQRTRQKGASYFYSDRVDSVTISPDHVYADVEGSEDYYTVAIDLDKLGKKPGAMSCSCPWFAKGNNCKHLWATLLYLDHREPEAIEASSPIHSWPQTTSLPVVQQPQDLWRSVFRAVNARRYEVESRTIRAHDNEQIPSRVHYVIDVSRLSRQPGHRRLLVSLALQEHVHGDVWAQPEPLCIDRFHLGLLESPADEQILTQLLGVEQPRSNPPRHQPQWDPQPAVTEFYLSPDWGEELISAVAATGRLGWALSLEPLDEITPIEIDFDAPYEVTVEFEEHEGSAAAQLTVSLQNNTRTYGCGSVLYVSDDGLALLPDRLVRIANPPAVEFLRSVQGLSTDIVIPPEDRSEFLDDLAQLHDAPMLRFPAAWAIEQRTVSPQGQLSIGPPKSSRSTFTADLSFRYEDCEVHATDTHSALFDKQAQRWLFRDFDAERDLCDELISLPIGYAAYDVSPGYRNLQIAPDSFEPLVGGLAERGWRVLWEGKPLRPSGNFNIQVTSGQDWFDVHATIDFEGENVELPQLLAALKQGDSFVTLADGSRGKLPEELLARYARLANFGELRDDAVRFRPSQAMLLDALLDAHQQVVIDPGFREYRKKLKSFAGIKPRNSPRGFIGQLRDYQQAGVGWLHFLQDFNFGGCLADDMGLGKTIQILALLETRRTRRLAGAEPEILSPTWGDSEADDDELSGQPLLEIVAKMRRRPSIVIVPKSLVFNWLDEAARFTPRLRLHNHTGSDRLDRTAQSDGFDVLITTYGTLRRDIAYLSRITFDYAILDESQAIKNANAQAAKASRLLVADHRLAMTGTPIENHLGELWSLFEFLNPGLLGRSTAFASLMNRKARDNSHQEAVEALARGLKPFILRRTKDQVLDDLPAKTEQTLHCQMSPPQRKQYDELRDYYRIKLSSKIKERGLKQSKIHVLEALLRLRQVACDPRLVDPAARPGGKLKLLQEQIAEVVEEGHKVLVFSQFTKLLGLVRADLEKAGVVYEYLDGRTSNRGDKVRRFQEDEDVRLFLISLKAGGHGLNLTAADYVYLLDPWWNPAVEAQAIDRAHRMGQQRPVNAYRIICEHTVEEKIIQLQQTKRDLADRIIQADDSLIRRLSPEDLELLLS